MPKRLIVILSVLLAAAFAVELVVPYAVGRMMARAMAEVTGTDQVEAEVVKHPALLMFGGSFDKIRVRADAAKVDKIVFAELDAVLRDVRLDMNALVTRRSLAVKTVRDIDLTAVITQDELSRYLNQSVKGVRNATVAIEGGRVRVSSNFLLGQIASVAVTLDGKIVGDGQKLKFVTERFLLNNTAVGNIGGSVLTEIQLVDLKKLPFGVSVREVVSEGGKVVITADNRPQ